MVVSKEDFDYFIAHYPRPLTSSVVMFCEPPVRVYTDSSLYGDSYESIVASIALFEVYSKDGTPPYVWALNEYRIG